MRLLGTAVHTGVLAHLFSIFFHSQEVPTVHQIVVTLVNRFSLESDEDQSKSRSRHHQGGASTTESYRPRGATLGSFGAPRRVPAQHAPFFVVEMEKGLLWLPVETSRGAHHVGTSSSHQGGPLAFTVRSKHSLQKGSKQWTEWGVWDLWQKGVPCRGAWRLWS